MSENTIIVIVIIISVSISAIIGLIFSIYKRNLESKFIIFSYSFFGGIFGSVFSPIVGYLVFWKFFYHLGYFGSFDPVGVGLNMINLIAKFWIAGTILGAILGGIIALKR